MEAASILKEFKATSYREFSGPLPLPDHFADYGRIRPGTASDIVRMAEREQDIKDASIRGTLKNERLKSWGAILLGVGLLAIAGLATYMNQPIIAIPLGLAPLTTFLLRRFGRHWRED